MNTRGLLNVIIRSIVATPLAALAAPATPGPIVPCDGAATVPATSPLGAAPNVIAVGREDSRAWTPPACTGWTGAGSRSLVAISGTVRIAGGSAAVLARFGAVSTLAGMRYWSVSGQSWQTLVTEAHALDAAAGQPGRADLPAAELASGRALAFSQTDNDAGRITYRMRVLAATPSRVVLGVENVDTIRRFLIPLYGPGELQSVYVLERATGPDAWSYYSLTRAAAGASALTDGHESSTVNRAVALFRHIAGIATDLDPPAAPR